MTFLYKSDETTYPEGRTIRPGQHGHEAAYRWQQLLVVRRLHVGLSFIISHLSADQQALYRELRRQAGKLEQQGDEAASYLMTAGYINFSPGLDRERVAFITLEDGEATWFIHSDKQGWKVLW